MPIFEYRCIRGHTTEVINISGQVHAPFCCPECGEGAVLVPSVVHMQTSAGGAKESFVSGAIKRVKQAEREGRLD